MVSDSPLDEMVIACIKMPHYGKVKVIMIQNRIDCSLVEITVIV